MMTDDERDGVGGGDEVENVGASVVLGEVFGLID